MIYIERLAKPEILVQKQEEWTDKFMKSGNKRPDNSKYGHKQIRNSLNSMSFHKCFYCERKLTGVSKEIDHFIEVADPNGKELAYEWNNLYLACDNCNDKFDNTNIPISEVIDPCSHSDIKIQKHLTFDDECITARNNSDMGLRTIKKFRLDTELLDMLRSKQLSLFYKILHQINVNRINDKGRKMNEDEKECLKKFAQKDHQFSLMFKNLLSKYNLID